MRMSFGTVVAGVVLIMITVVFMTVGISTLTFQPPPSDIARPMSDAEIKGREIYMGNGCVYCHTQYVRPQDWNAAGGGKAARPAQAGDYVFQKTMLLGTERTGPDLSQEGGVHPDDWHVAHFQNPRYVNPNSIMPQFSYVSGVDAAGKLVPNSDLANLITYVQSLGQKAADVRSGVQADEKKNILASLNGKSGEPNVGYDDKHLAYLKQQVPPSWVDLRSAMPPTNRSLTHGRQIYLQNCIGCHGLEGNGKGPSAQYLNPKPFNFTDGAAQAKASEGQMYEFLLFGLPGSAMPAFGDYLTVNDIWDVINFVRTVPNNGLKVDNDKLLYNLQIGSDGKYPGIGPQPSCFDQNAEGYTIYPPPTAYNYSQTNPTGTAKPTSSGLSNGTVVPPTDTPPPPPQPPLPIPPNGVQQCQPIPTPVDGPKGSYQAGT